MFKFLAILVYWLSRSKSTEPKVSTVFFQQVKRVVKPRHTGTII